MNFVCSVLEGVLTWFRCVCSVFTACECGRRHASACLHSFFSLERRLLDSSSETSCASASTLLCVEIYELSAKWKVSTTARKHPADTCSSKCSAALRSAQQTNIESFVKRLPASEPIRSKGGILVTVLCCYVHESITVFELKKTLKLKCFFVSLRETSTLTKRMSNSLPGQPTTSWTVWVHSQPR